MDYVSELDIVESVTHGTGTHLGQAADCLFLAFELNAGNGNVHARYREHRNSVSTVIHSFCAFEHAVNLFLFYKYVHGDNAMFVPLESRSVLELKFSSSLQDQDIITKMNYLCESLPDWKIRAGMSNRLSETRLLRNRLCHGFTEEKHLLLSLVEGTASDDGKVVTAEYRQVDAEYSPSGDKKEWRKVVPLTKYSHPDSLGYDDGMTAFQVCAQAIDYLGDKFGLDFGAAWYRRTERRLIRLGRSKPGASSDGVTRESLKEFFELFDDKTSQS